MLATNTKAQTASLKTKAFASVKLANFVSRFFTYFFVILVVLFVLLPYFWMISNSFKTTFEIQTADVTDPGTAPSWIPRNPTLQNYIDINKTVPMLKFLKNSLIISLGTAALSIIISVGAAYALSRFRFRGDKAYEVAIYSTQMFPGMAFLIPYFVMFIFVRNTFGISLMNTYEGMIFTYTSFALPYSILMLRDYFNTIPKELDEQAQIDGCTRLQIIIKFIIPLAVPGLVSVGIYSFMMGWNEMLFASVLTKTETRTVALGLMDYITVNGAQWGGMMAACIVTSLPVLILFTFLQKQIVGGLTAGATKG